MSESLPEGYADLEPFVARWSVSGAVERAALHESCDSADRLAFYKAVRSRVKGALTALEGKPLGELDERERRLLNLMLSFARVASEVESRNSFEMADRTP